MEVNIGNKDYVLYFGWDFLEQINNMFGMKIDANGAEINTRTAGLPFVTVGLESKDPVTVVKVIQAATNTYPNKPAKINIEKFVQEKLENDIDDYLILVEEIDEEIKKSSLLKAMSKLNAK